MAHDLTATQARTVSTTDLVIYNEIDTITRAIYAAGLAGDLSTSVNDGTTMTESTPTITVTGTVADPVVGGAGEALTLAGGTVSLPANSDVDQIVAAINDEAITGLTASKNASSQVVLTYEPPMATWSLVISGDSGNTTIGITTGTVPATDPESVTYYNVWIGQTEDRKKSYEFAQVINHFQGLGYNIVAKQNTTTTNTFYWEIYW